MSLRLQLLLLGHLNIQIADLISVKQISQYLECRMLFLHSVPIGA